MLCRGKPLQDASSDETCMKRMHRMAGSCYLRVELVGQGLEVDGGGRNLLAIGSVVAMGQVAAAGQVQAHDAVVGLQQRCVHCKVGRAAQTGAL